MGVIFSKLYGGKPSTRDTLERIEQEIQNIEESRWDKIKREQFVVQILSFIPVTILIATVCLLVYPSESSLRDKIVRSIPIIIVNLILWVCKKIVQWYSKWSLDNEEMKLRKLLKEKKRILELVCETESYKVATELLEKYDPKQLRRREKETERSTSPINKTLTKFTASPIKSPNQQRMQQHQHQQQQHQQPQIQTYPSFLNQSINLPAPPAPPVATIPTPNVKATPSKPELNVTSTNLHNASIASVAASSVQGRPVRPIISKDRSFFEKVVDWVVTDGPDNRFALICRYCYGHNGMSLAEEYETLNFRCCFCYNLNTATQKRQVHDQLQSEREEGKVYPKINEGADKGKDEQNDGNSKSDQPSVEKTSERSENKKRKGGSKQKTNSSILSTNRSTLVDDIVEQAETTVDQNSKLLDKSQQEDLDSKDATNAEDKTETSTTPT